MSSNPDPFDLARFVRAQKSNYNDAIAELRAGRKRTHWSWYVFPQIQGLGSSPMSVCFAINSLAEAKAYLDHAVLGRRLRECVKALNALEGMGADEVLGSVDAQKLYSSLTLFSQVAPSDEIFAEALGKFYEGRLDRATLRILNKLHVRDQRA